MESFIETKILREGKKNAVSFVTGCILPNKEHTFNLGDKFPFLVVSNSLRIDRIQFAFPKELYGELWWEKCDKKEREFITPLLERGVYNYDWVGGVGCPPDCTGGLVLLLNNPDKYTQKRFQLLIDFTKSDY